MKRNKLILPIAILLGVSALVYTTAIGQSTGKNTVRTSDTVPERKKKIKDIDDALVEIELSKKELEQSLKEIDYKKIEEEIKTALEKLSIDKEKMKQDIEKAIAEIKSEDIHKQIDEAMKDIDSEKIHMELSKAMAKINTEEMKKQLDEIKAVDFSKIQEELKNIQPQIEKSMKEAKESIKKAELGIKAYKSFINGLEADGLINKAEGYKIEYKAGELTINGKKASSETVTKYQDFLKEKKDFTIKKTKDDFDIHNN
jgi:ABC-type Zn2+ transport system substrate-binding protein/surface adhesin